MPHESILFWVTVGALAGCVIYGFLQMAEDLVKDIFKYRGLGKVKETFAAEFIRAFEEDFVGIAKHTDDPDSRWPQLVRLYKLAQKAWAEGSDTTHV